MYRGQALQDKWVVEYFNEKREGYFLDIGAMDGITASNTYILETKYRWKGLCVEPYYLHLTGCKMCRRVPIIEKALYSSNGHLSFDTNYSTVMNSGILTVPTISFTSLIEENNVPEVIDYISLDIEGAEYEALTSFPWDTHIGILWTIEHNSYINGPALKNQVKQIMLKHDYVVAFEDVCCPDSNNLPFEDWFVHKNYVK